MAIVILKSGNNKQTARRFSCPNCFCTFLADEDDYYIDTWQSHNRTWTKFGKVCHCPECGCVAPELQDIVAEKV